MIGRRRFAALLLTLPGALAGCGWEPLYADRETGPADEALRSIKVNPVAERVGQKLAMGLRKSFNPTGIPTPQRFVLTVSLGTSLISLGIQSQGLGTRGSVNVSGSYNLQDIKGGAPLTTGSIHAVESFDIQANGYSTVVAEDDAYTRCAEEIRHELVARLTLFMQRRAGAAKS